jgi:hypothetical protein
MISANPPQYLAQMLQPCAWHDGNGAPVWAILLTDRDTGARRIVGPFGDEDPDQTLTIAKLDPAEVRWGQLVVLPNEVFHQAVQFGRLAY